MRWWAVLAVLFTFPPTATAQPATPPAFQLRWSAPVGCPAEPEVTRETQRLLGASTAAARAPIEAEGRVTAVKGGFELQLSVGPSGHASTRQLEAPSCDELARAAALVVAVAVDPSLSLPEAEGSGKSPLGALPACSEGMPAAVPAPTCPLCDSCPPPPVPRREQGSPWHIALVAGVSIAYRELPQLTPRPNLGLAYRTQAHWLELSGGAAFAATGRSTDGRVATFSHWYGVPRYCFEALLDWGRFGGCAVLEIGRIRASGFGVTLPKTQRSWWVAPGLGLQLTRRMRSGAELIVGAEALVATVRPDFYLASEPLFRPNLVIPALRLGLLGGVL
jgi:hypothetical protein